MLCNTMSGFVILAMLHYLLTLVSWHQALHWLCYRSKRDNGRLKPITSSCGNNSS